MASEIVFSKLGMIDRLSLLDPGKNVKTFPVPDQYRIEGKKQYGMVNRV